MGEYTIITGIEKRGTFGKIKYILQLLPMQRMVRKLRDFQDVYIEETRKDIKDIDIRNTVSLSKERHLIPQDNLYLKCNDKEIFRTLYNGGREEFRNFPREFRKNEEIIDSCVKKEFIKQEFKSEDNRWYVAVKPDGIKFLEFDYFIETWFQTFPTIGKIILLYIPVLIGAIFTPQIFEFFKNLILNLFKINL